MITRLITASVAVAALLCTGAGWAHADDLACATGSACRAVASRPSPVSAPAGTHAVGRIDTPLTDPARDRTVMVSAWYPAAETGMPAPYVPASGPVAQAHIASRSADWMHTPAAAGAMLGAQAAATEGAPIAGDRLPVVVLSPGLGTPRWILSGLAAELASRGTVVVTMDHTGETPAVQLADGSIVDGQLPFLTDDQMGARLEVRIADARLVLDRLATLPIVGAHVDLGRIAVGGHSYGGTTGAQLAARDTRVQTVVMLDSPAGWQGVVGAPTLTVPVLDLQTTTPWADGWPRMTGPTVDHVVVERGAHYTPTDLCAFGADQVECGALPAGQAATVTRGAIVDFLDQHL